jgi:alpha-aminoadipic semialdehyde synthase
MNAIFWTPANPIFLNKAIVKKLYNEGAKKLVMVGDITCDIAGSVEFNVKATTPGNPVYTYDPVEEKYEDGIKKDGITVLAVDNLPCEFPADSSTFFSNALMTLMDKILALDPKEPYRDDTPKVIRDAIICQKGELTPKYKYLEKFLK